MQEVEEEMRAVRKHCRHLRDKCAVRTRLVFILFYISLFFSCFSRRDVHPEMSLEQLAVVAAATASGAVFRVPLRLWPRHDVTIFVTRLRPLPLVFSRVRAHEAQNVVFWWGSRRSGFQKLLRFFLFSFSLRSFVWCP